MGEIINDTNVATNFTSTNIKDLIITVRGVQVLLDSDVAMLYGYETKTINQAANRNSKRFPLDFRFQLTEDEANQVLRYQKGTLNSNTLMASLRSQIVTLNTGRGSNLKYLPYAYTEQGIGMLSGILKNDTAVQVSIGIMNAFVEMRRIITTNRFVFEQISNINTKLLQHDNELSKQSIKISEILSLLNEPDTNKQWIFYKGQFYDAYKLVIELVEKAKASIIVVDNYADNSILDILANKKAGVSVIIVTANPGKISIQNINKFTAQYGTVKIVTSKDFHDRFVILDEKEVYAFGASLKDLGNKCFEVSKSENPALFTSYIKGII